jgi:hypothetical protein
MKEPIGHIAVIRPRGSALILTVVLTSLLAIVGVLFMMAARIDKMSATATTENRELSCAVDTLLTRIDRELVLDIPLVAPNQEYYDFPDANNLWLADLEPYESGGNYYWGQITNLVGSSMVRSRNVAIRAVGERDAIDPNLRTNARGTTADADGDGVGDSRWFRIPGIMTSKGKPFYAAVRIIDNGGMLNVNTGFRPDPNESVIPAGSPLQINVLGLTGPVGSEHSVSDEMKLLAARANRGADSVATTDLPRYERDVIWHYLDVQNPDANHPSPYTPFDISDELELRYRYLLNQDKTDTRIEACGRFTPSTILSRPVDANSEVKTWFPRAADGTATSYAYRHVATTYNMDRIITPQHLSLKDGTHRGKMVNVNTTDEETLLAAVTAALLETEPNAVSAEIDQTAAQITANLRDYIDDDDEVTVIGGGGGSLTSAYYGFERPCIYISELACRQVKDNSGTVHSSFAIELYKPYFEDRDPKPDEWSLKIHNPSDGKDFEVPLMWTGSRRFHVVLAEDAAAPLSEGHLVFTDANEPVDTMPLYAYNRADYALEPQTVDPTAFRFEEGATISLRRAVSNGAYLMGVDLVKVPEGWMAVDDTARSIQRDISPHKCVRRLWATGEQVSTPALGNSVGQFVDVEHPGFLQAHPANRPLTSIGELGMIFRENAYGVSEGALGADALIDLANPLYSRLFNYLTVVDPARYPWLNRMETRVMGRININTAPAFVLAQLPWMTYVARPEDNTRPTPAARVLYAAGEIVKHRSAHGPYRSTADLMRVAAMRALGSDELDNARTDTPMGPDPTPDEARDDFEERDAIFARISDLVTVRSDVFTAYILVRIGETGPQKRVIAIFDRSQVGSTGDRVRVIALHPMPDPR